MAYVKLDQQFADFCAGRYSLERHLADHPTLVIVKSMSKAYGVTDTRPGVAVHREPAQSGNDLGCHIAGQCPVSAQVRRD